MRASIIWSCSVSLVLSFAKLFVRLSRLLATRVRHFFLAVTTSEDVGALLVHVTEVVQRRRLAHRLAICHASPDVHSHVFAVLHCVLFDLFDVRVLGGATVSTDALVVTGLEHVTILEGTEEGLFLNLWLLSGEGDVGAVGCEVGVEGATLLNRVAPWLVAMNNLAVLVSILTTSQVLLALIRILGVAHLVLAGERVGLDTSPKSGSRLGNGALGRSKRNVFEFRLANQLVSGRAEWCHVAHDL